MSAEGSPVAALVAAGRGLGTRPRLWLFVYVFGVLAYFVPAPTWNPVSRVSLTRSIVERGTFELGPLAKSTGDRAKVGERYYSDKAPLPSFLAVPAYAVLHAVHTAQGRAPAFEAVGDESHPAVRLRVSPAFRTSLYVSSVSTSALSGALLAVGLFSILRRRVEERPALLAAAGTVMGTPILPYGASFFGHTIAAAALLSAFAIVDPMRAARPGSRQIVAAGLLLGCGAASEYIVALPAGVLALWCLSWWPAGDRARVLGCLLLGALVPAVLVGLYHAVCFGSPFRTGYDYIVHPAFSSGQRRGFFGITRPRFGVALELLFGSSRGLFYVSPASAVAVGAGVWAFWRRRDPGLAVGATLFGLLLLVNAGYFQWDGGWATGPRHLVPALGFLGLGLGYALASPRMATLAAVALGLSITILLLTTAVALEAPPGQDALLDYLVPSIRQGRIARVAGSANVGMLLGLSRRASILPLLVWVVVGAVILVARAPRGTEQGEGRREPQTP